MDANFLGIIANFIWVGCAVLTVQTRFTGLLGTLDFVTFFSGFAADGKNESDCKCNLDRAFTTVHFFYLHITNMNDFAV